jgi:hypothetical protein
MTATGVHKARGQQFASDNQAGICPDAFAAIAEANAGHQPAYGDDVWTKRAADLLRDLFETDWPRTSARPQARTISRLRWRTTGG